MPWHTEVSHSTDHRRRIVLYKGRTWKGNPEKEEQLEKKDIVSNMNIKHFRRSIKKKKSIALFHVPIHKKRNINKDINGV